MYVYCTVSQQQLESLSLTKVPISLFTATMQDDEEVLSSESAVLAAGGEVDGGERMVL